MRLQGEKPPSRPTRARSSSVGFGCDDKVYDSGTCLPHSVIVDVV